MTNLNDYKEAKNRIETAKQNQSNSLDLEYLSLSIVPYTISDLDWLTELKLGFGEIKDFSFLDDLPNLQKLKLRATQVDNLSFLANLNKLSELTVWDIKVTNLSFLQALPLLQKLVIAFDVDSDYILDKHSMFYFADLKNLKELSINLFYNNYKHDFQQNIINDFSFIENMPLLEDLFLNNLKISSVNFLEKQIYLKRLGLSNNLIQDISPISKLENLEVLSLQNNNFTDIEPLAELKKLTFLNLSKNPKIPKTYKVLKRLPNLKRLRCDNNELTSIDFIKDLTRIESLDFENNELSNIDVFKQYEFNFLQHISLQGCKIKDIEIFKVLPQLKSLDLSINEIEYIATLEGFQNMETLSLMSNRIKEVTKNWLDAPKLTELVILGNPIKNIPSFYMEGWNVLDKLKIYFSGELPNEKVNNVIKLLIIGNQSTGKTALKQTLLDSNATNNEWRPSNKLCYKIMEIDSLPFYHQIQEFWMRTEALVLVVWDLEQEQRQTPYLPNYSVHYWVDRAKNQFKIWKSSMGDDSDENNFVFSVQNKIALPEHYDTAPAHYGQLLKKHKKNSIKKYSIDTHEKTDIEFFKRELSIWGASRLAIRLKIMHQWVEVRNAVEQITDWSINKKKLLEIIETCRLEASIYKNIIYWLQNIGTVCYLNDDFILLKEDIVLKTICQIFNGNDWFSKMIKANNGVFNQSVLSFFELEMPISITLALMEAYKIAYPLDEAKSYWCVPSWARKKQQNQVYDIFSNHFQPRFFKKYKFNFFTYTDVIHCLTTIYNQYAITDNHHHWKTGIYFQWKDRANTYGFFEADMKTYSITIGMAGDSILALSDQLFIVINTCIHGAGEQMYDNFAVATDKSHFVPIDVIEKYALMPHKLSFDYKFRHYTIAHFYSFLPYLPQQKSKKVVQAPEIKKMIYMSANSSKTKGDDSEEVAKIRKTFEPYQKTWDCKAYDQVSTTDFLKNMMQPNIGIIHFTGYGVKNNDKILTFVSSDGRSKAELSVEQLNKDFEVVKRHNVNLELVVLQSAESYAIAQKLSELNIHVLGIKGKIDNQVTIKSSEIFYHSLLNIDFDVAKAADFAGCMIEGAGADAAIHLYHNGIKINK